MKVRAAVLRESGLAAPFATSRPLSIEEVDLAPPGPGEVLVKIVAAGICHSDLSVIEGIRPRPLPMVIGHESAGVVVEVGPYVSGLAVGDHVVSVFVPGCGHCVPCSGGRPALCEPGAQAGATGTLLGGHRRLSLVGQPVNHHSGISGFAEYATVSQFSLVKVDKDLPLDEAALFGCAVLTGVGAAVNSAQVQPGTKVAVIGMGGVGMAALLGSLAAGASTAIAIDTNDDKLKVAKSLGATHCFNARDSDVIAAVQEATAGGVDTVIEVAGAAAALELGYAITRRGGQLVTAGLPPPTAKLQIPAVSLVAEEKTIRGSYMGSSVPARDLPRYIELYRHGRLPIDRLVTHRMRLDDINEGMDRLQQGVAIRQLVLMG